MKEKKELTSYQKKLLATFDSRKAVKFRYNVVDCEHWGDVGSDENTVRKYVEPLGGKVTDTYWDGVDCGEAYIECEIPYAALEKVLLDGFFEYDPWQ